MEHDPSLASATLYKIRAAFFEIGLEKASIYQEIASLRQNCKSLSLLGLSFALLSTITSAEGPNHPPQNTKDVLLEGTIIRCRVADEPHSRSRGLSGREPLPLGEGMLFEFDYRDHHGFWMKDMTFPIDIIWFDQGEIVHMVSAELPKPDEGLKIYAPKRPSRYVLEVAAGTFAANGWALGTKVIILGED